MTHKIVTNSSISISNGDGVQGEAMLEVTGLVQHPRVFAFRDLVSLPGQVPDIAAIFPKRSGGAIRLDALLAAAGLRSGASHLTLESTDGKFSASVPLDAVAPRGIVVYREGDVPLPEDKGGPVRFLIQDVESCGLAEVDLCANVKFLGRIVVTGTPGRDTRPTTQKQHEALHQH